MDTYQQLAASVLVAHQRRDSGSCLCGWSHLGRSHAEHVAGVLAASGALQVVPAERVEATCDPRDGVRHATNPTRCPGDCFRCTGCRRCTAPADGDHGLDLTVGHDAWWTIHGEELAAALNRVAQGQRPSTVYAELYANTERTT